MQQLMTQAEFARHRGVSKGCVTNWKNDGLLIMAEGPGGRPMVDVQRSEMRLNAKIDPMRGRPSTGGASEPTAAPGGDAPALPLEAGGAGPVRRDDLADERALQVREQRVGQALKNARLAGELVPLIEAERRVSEVGRAMRDRMHAWLRANSERFAAEKDVRQIMALGEAGIDEVFAELAAAAEAGAFAGDDDLSADEVAELEQAAAAE